MNLRPVTTQREGRINFANHFTNIMMHSKSKPFVSSFLPHAQAVRRWALLLLLAAAFGCRSGNPQKQNREFFTSGSREADQRASQTMAKHEQLTGSGEGSGEKGVKKASKVKTNADLTPTGSTNKPGTTNKPAQVEGKLALFDRLGGDAGI